MIFRSAHKKFEDSLALMKTAEALLGNATEIMDGCDEVEALMNLHSLVVIQRRSIEEKFRRMEAEG